MSCLRRKLSYKMSESMEYITNELSVMNRNFEIINRKLEIIDEMNAKLSDIDNKVIDIDRRVTDINDRVKTIESLGGELKRDISIEAPAIQQDFSCTRDPHHNQRHAVSVNRGYRGEAGDDLELRDIDVGSTKRGDK